MKNKVKPLSSLIILFLAALTLAACTQESKSQNTAADDTVSTTIGTEKVTETEPPESTTADITTASQTDQESVVSMSPIRLPENANVELFSSPILDDTGKEYTVRAYIYNNNEDIFAAEEDMTKGWAAIELLYNGEQVYCQEYQVGYIGQTAPSFNMEKTEDYFKVLQLDGRDVFTCARSGDDQLWFRQYYTVSDGKLKVMERYFSEEEVKQAEGHRICPNNATYDFITPDKFTVDKNRIIYQLETETLGLSAYSLKEGSYPAGEIPLVFDFENNIVKCEKDEYCGLVYFYYDLG